MRVDSSVNFHPNDRSGKFEERDEDNFSQAGDLLHILNEDRKQQLFANIAEGSGQSPRGVQERLLDPFEQAYPANAAGVREALASHSGVSG